MLPDFGRYSQSVWAATTSAVSGAGPGGDAFAERSTVRASSAASLFDDAHTACEVGLALLRLNGDMSCNDDHGYAPVLSLFLSPSCPARRAVPQRWTSRAGENSSFGNPNQPANIDRSRTVARPLIE